MLKPSKSIVNKMHKKQRAQYNLRLDLSILKAALF